MEAELESGPWVKLLCLIETLTIYSEHHYNLGDELRIKMSANGRIFIGRVIEVKTNADNENSYTFALNENKRDWFREAVQNALGGPPGR